MTRFFALLLLSATLLLTGCGSLSRTAHTPIPPLDPRGDVYKTEGPNDPLIYASTVGKKKAIMLYVDFPNKPQTIDTKEREAKVLGGDTFQKLFADNSYGKLTIDIDHVHGWRRMPKPSESYNSDETLPHRDLWIEILALYPEINFLDYDYIMANMDGHGNVAFGARDDEAIPYRGTFIRVALNIASQSPYVLAHETGHLMGLPDLYTYGDLEPKNPTGPWDLMSSSNSSTAFIGWHRHKLGWLDNNRKTYLTQGTHKLTLTPLSTNKGLSLIAVPVDNPQQPSKVFVIEVAQTLRMKKDAPKPGGVLIYSVDAKLPTGENPLVVYPRESKVNAAFHGGDRFDHADAPMSVDVLKHNDDGSYTIEVTIKPQK